MNLWAPPPRLRRPLIALSLFLVALIGLADYATGYHLSLGFFYLAPIGLMAWFRSFRAGVAVAVLSSAVWYWVNGVSAPAELGSAILLWNTAIRLGFFLVVSWLLASLRQAYDSLQLLAGTDALTGLLNSRAFKERAALELLRAERIDYVVAVCYLDLDNFKELNDSRGHAAGDSLLAAIGASIRGALRVTDVAGRLGGDEFALLLSGPSHESLEAAARRLRAAVLEACASQDSAVTATIGFTVFDGDESLESLLRRADATMYRAKESAKGSIELDKHRSAARPTEPSRMQ